MKDEKGITISALAITIIVLLIITSISVYSGTSTVRYAQYNKARSEMELMQTTVNAWNLEYNNFETDDLKSKARKQRDFIEAHGIIAKNNNLCDQETLTLTQQNTEITNDNLRFLSRDFISSNLGMDDSFEFLIDIPTSTVILFGGIEYNGKTYYTIEDFDIQKTESIEPVKSITFELEKNDDEKEIIINNLVFKDNNNNEANISKFIVEYTISGKEKWHTTKIIQYEEDGDTKYKFTVDEPDYYDVRISTTDKKVISDFNTVRITTLDFAEKEIDFLAKNKMIDTGIKLFSEENREKDFIIRFTIDEFGNNVTNDTLINSMREDDTSLWPGFVFRCSNTNKYHIKFNANTSTKPTREYTTSELLGKEVIISRSNKVIFIQVGNGPKTVLVDLKSVDTTQFYNEVANTSLTLGASFDPSKNTNNGEQRYFSGKVSNVEIALFEHRDKIIREREIYVAQDNIVLTKTNSNQLIFDGTNGLPDIRLFSAANINKNFEIKIRVDSFGEEFAPQDTILSTKAEVEGSTAVAPGFAIRRSSQTNLEVKGSNTGHTGANSKFLGKTITIKRIDGTYTSEVEGDNTIKTFSVNSNVNDSPLTIGCIRYSNGKLDRKVNCIISKLTIKIIEEVDL